MRLESGQAACTGAGAEQRQQKGAQIGEHGGKLERRVTELRRAQERLPLRLMRMRDVRPSGSTGSSQILRKISTRLSTVLCAKPSRSTSRVGRESGPPQAT